jgi:SAM-dependent methyltransferase
MVAGEAYVAAITSHEADRAARRAFQDLVVRIASPVSYIFDFGAGPGIDAKFYAERGLKVIAYDHDPRMCAAFARRCQSEIEQGQVRLYEGEYGEFLRQLAPALHRQYDIELVTCNFAPLNLIEDLPGLFRALHQLTAKRAKVLASVLNPWFLGDVRRTWWWTRRLAYLRRGRFTTVGPTGNVFRRSRADFAAQAAPHFTLEMVLRGLPERATPSIKSVGPLALASSRYMFLLFAKR